MPFFWNNDKEGDFDKALQELNQKYQEKINFRCVGPLPPYSFSTMEVKRISFEEIDEARKLLELDQETTLNEIKESYRRLSQKYHPDNDPHNPDLQKKFENITKAYKMLAKYCQEGRCSFKAAEMEDFFLVEVMKI